MLQVFLSDNHEQNVLLNIHLRVVEEGLEGGSAGKTRMELFRGNPFNLIGVGWVGWW